MGDFVVMYVLESSVALLRSGSAGEHSYKSPHLNALAICIFFKRLTVVFFAQLSAGGEFLHEIMVVSNPLWNQ